MWMDLLAAFASGVPAFGRTGSALQSGAGGMRQCCCSAPVVLANLWAIDPGSAVAWTQNVDSGNVNNTVLDIDTDASGNVYVITYSPSVPLCRLWKYDSTGTIQATGSIGAPFSAPTPPAFISTNGSYVAAANGSAVKAFDSSLSALGPQRSIAPYTASSLVVDYNGFAWIGTTSGVVFGFSIPGIGGVAPQFTGSSVLNTGIALDTMTATPSYVYQVNNTAPNRLSSYQIGVGGTAQATNAHNGLARRTDGSLVTGRTDGSVERYTVSGTTWTLADTWTTGGSLVTNVKADANATAAVGASDGDGKSTFVFDSAGTLTFRWAIDSNPAITPYVAKPAGSRVYVGGASSTTWQSTV